MRLLGPVELEIDGVRLGVGGPRAQAVLALLAVRAGKVVTADWLIDQVWGAQPPRAARVALQSYISRVRRLAVPETSRMLPVHPRGYLLDSSVAGIDVPQFTRLSEQGRSYAAVGRWREALEILRIARALWHGVPFTGIDEVSALTAERYRLEEMNLETHFSELKAALEIVGPADVVGSLLEFVNTRPCDERGWQLLMLALYRDGRQTEALEAAARARHLLAEEQGLEPSQDLTELEHRILTQHPALKPAPPPVQLRGWISTTPAPLIGRERELTELLAEWQKSCRRREAHLVLVTGEPGVGKSHLVAELARNIEEDGGTALAGRCLDEPRIPLQPWSDLLADGEIPEPPAVRRLGDNPSLLDGWEVSAHRLFSTITTRFRQMLRSGAVLLVTEDLQWADVAAVRMLDRLLAYCAALPLLVVATVRSSAPRMLPPARGALSELSTRVHPALIRLDGLELPDLQAMLADRGVHVTAAEAASIWRRSDGVPLLALEALHGGERVLEARLATVSDTAATVSDLLAASGGHASLALLHTASDFDETTLVAALEELVCAGLIRAAPGSATAFEFCHLLYREAVEARLSDLRRFLLSRRMHGLVGNSRPSAPPSTA